MWLLLIGLLIVIAFYFLGTYNKFVTTKTRIKASIQEIGNQLKRQAALIPNLTAAVKGYMKHEKSIFKALTDARKSVMEAVESGKADKMINAGDLLQKALQPIKVLVESNPQVQAAGPTTKLMDELRDTADKLMYSRRTLIDLTADYNVMVVTFPSNLVAKLFKFSPEKGLKSPAEGEHIEVSVAETKTPKVEL